MGNATEFTPKALKKLAAPDRSVRAIPGTIPCETEHRARQLVLGHAGRHMGVMVLNSHERSIPLCSQGFRMPGGSVVRVQVAGHRLGRHAEELD